MACAGCDQCFRDRGGTVARSTYPSLCYDCMCEVLEVYESTPERKLKILKHLIDNGFSMRVPGIQTLVQEQIDELEARMTDPYDRLFNPRG